MKKEMGNAFRLLNGIEERIDNTGIVKLGVVQILAEKTDLKHIIEPVALGEIADWKIGMAGAEDQADVARLAWPP
ncbi:hypothetical protein D3C73_1370680 [compost metagenome]